MSLLKLLGIKPSPPEGLRRLTTKIEHELFNLKGRCYSHTTVSLDKKAVRNFEKAIRKYEKQGYNLTGFRSDLEVFKPSPFFYRILRIFYRK